MDKQYIEHRLADLKSDREQILFWLHKTEEEIKELEDANRQTVIKAN